MRLFVNRLLWVAGVSIAMSLLPTSASCLVPLRNGAVAGAATVGTAPTILPTPAGAGSMAVAMNWRGDVIGYVLADTGWSPVLWRQDGSLTRLPARMDSLVAINDRGDVLGYDFESEYAYLVRDGATIQLSHPGGAVRPHALNNSGQVVGYIDTWGTGSEEAFLWQDGAFSLMPAVPGMNSTAVDVNEAGQVLVSLFAVDGVSGSRTVIWQHGVVTGVGAPGNLSIQPGAINNRGQVVVNSRVADGVTLPFLWDRGRMTRLPLPATASSGSVTAINDNGDAVGQAGLRAVLWHDGGVTAIGPPSGTSEAWVINERGDVGGVFYGDDPNQAYERQLRAFRWNGRLTVLDSLPGSWGVGVVGIDDRGRLAGTIVTVLGTTWTEHAVVWSAT